MFETILVPVDFSERNVAALRCAFDLAEPSAGTVTLLHVIERIEDTSDDELDGFYAELEDKAEQQAQTLLKQIERPPAARIEYRTVYGSRAQEIVRYAEEHGPDLIVLTSHRVDPERPEESLGTISQKAALFAPCPVLLVR